MYFHIKYTIRLKTSLSFSVTILQQASCVWKVLEKGVYPLFFAFQLYSSCKCINGKLKINLYAQNEFARQSNKLAIKLQKWGELTLLVIQREKWAFRLKTVWSIPSNFVHKFGQHSQHYKTLGWIGF